MAFEIFDQILQQVSQRYGYRLFTRDKENGEIRIIYIEPTAPSRINQGWQIWLDEPGADGQTRVHVIKSGYRETEQVFPASVQTLQGVLEKCISIALNAQD